VNARRRLSAVVMAVLILAAAACTEASPPKPAPTASSLALATRIEEYIESHSDRYAQIRSVRVQVDGQSRLQHYRHGIDGSSHLNVWGVTMSVLSMLVGIAIAEGEVPGVDARLAELLPGHVDKMTPVQERVTLEQLLTMSGGFADQQHLEAHVAASPPTKLTASALFAVDMQAPPAERFILSDISAHLVSAVLAEATGQTPLEYGQRVLFDPLGIQTEPANIDVLGEEGVSEAFNAAGFGWATDHEGLNLGCCFLKLTADDMVRLGQLYLDEGRWNDTPVVPADWVVASMRPTELNHHFSYLWWINELGGEPVLAAVGSGGQTIIVLPHLDAVITVASQAPDDLPIPDLLTQDDLLLLISTQIVPTLG